MVLADDGLLPHDVAQPWIVRSLRCDGARNCVLDRRVQVHSEVPGESERLLTRRTIRAMSIAPLKLSAARPTNAPGVPREYRTSAILDKATASIRATRGHAYFHGDTSQRDDVTRVEHTLRSLGLADAEMLSCCPPRGPRARASPACSAANSPAGAARQVNQVPLGTTNRSGTLRVSPSPRSGT